MIDHHKRGGVRAKAMNGERTPDGPGPCSNTSRAEAPVDVQHIWRVGDDAKAAGRLADRRCTLDLEHPHWQFPDPDIDRVPNTTDAAAGQRGQAYDVSPFSALRLTLISCSFSGAPFSLRAFILCAVVAMVASPLRLCQVVSCVLAFFASSPLSTTPLSNTSRVTVHSHPCLPANGTSCSLYGRHRASADRQVVSFCPLQLPLSVSAFLRIFLCPRLLMPSTSSHHSSLLSSSLPPIQPGAATVRKPRGMLSSCSKRRRV